MLKKIIEVNSVGYVVGKTVLVKSANQFSLEELCRTQYSLKYFLKPFRPSYRLEEPEEDDKRQCIVGPDFIMICECVRSCKFYPKLCLASGFTLTKGTGMETA